METDDVAKLQKEIRSLKKQVERLEASRATFELMVDRNDKLLSRQLEQTQHQAEELNRINLLADSALELANAGHWHLPLDNSGCYLPSERAARILGELPTPDHRYRLDEWAEHVREGDEAIARLTADNFAAAIAGTIPKYDATYLYKRPIDGRLVWIHALGHVVKDANGKPTDMYGVIQDITDFKQLETDLRQAMQKAGEERRRIVEITDNVPCVVFEFEKMRDGTARAPFVSGGMEAVIGVSADEVMKDVSRYFATVLPEDVEGYVADIDRSATTGSDHRFTVRIRHAVSGEIRWLYVDAPAPRVDAEGTARWRGYLQDITARRRAEEELQAAKKVAEEATTMKSMFLANMSHEIRTPMNAIIGLSHLALKTPLNPKQRDYVSKVHNAGTSLLSIINDILDFSKIEAGKLDIETTDFQLDEVISAVTTLTAQKAHDKGLEFLVHVDPAIPELLLGDPLRLGQILTNFVNNAVKFTDHGEIRLEIEQAERTGEKLQLKFSVRDSGIGMTKEQSAKLFQPFTQADMSTTRKHGGTGLGLTICLRLVELMGGRIWLESEPGLGTTFYFTAWLGVGSATGAGKIVPEKLAQLRVLVVDDNPAAREILQEPLSTLAARVDAVATGKEAIAAVQQHDATDPYDILFMDWRMPGMDGLQASRHIKSDETLKHQPAIVLVTAFGREEVREEAERLQLDGFLVKPVTKSMIVDTLMNVFAEFGEETTTIGEQETRLRGARVLLTEDNEINQQIAVELLEGAGATVRIANNGHEAVEILSNGPLPPPFDVVLMDLQMPVMDGYQATARLRADARFAKLTIIAMTAHATMDEKQLCLAAGMNDHISKPIDPDNLFETVGRFYSMPSSTIPPVTVESKQPEGRTPLAEGLPSIAGLDTKDGLTRVAGNQKLYVKLLRQFVEQQGPALGQITEALAKGDMALAERLAHTLKGVAGNIGAKSVQFAAGALEKHIRSKAADGEVDSAKQEVAGTLDPLVAQIRAALESGPSETPPQPPATVASPEQSREAAARLIKLFSEFDSDAVDFIEVNRAALYPLFNDGKWPQFEKLVQGYAFADAQAQLEQALKSLT